MIGRIVDRIVEAVSPRAGLGRMAARRAMDLIGGRDAGSGISNTGYSEHGASRGRQWSKGWNDRGGSAVEDVQANLSVLRRRSRLLYMAGGLGAAAIKRMRTNVIGTGLLLRAAPDADALGMDRAEAQAWARKVEREWGMWAESKDGDITRLNTFGELQGVALMNWLMSGDVIALLQEGQRPGQPYDLRINLVEADRVCTPGSSEFRVQSLEFRIGSGPEIRDGVELGSSGEVVAYHVANFHPLAAAFMPQGEKAKRAWTRVPVYGPESGRLMVLHLMEQERIGLYRGVPFLSGVIEDLKQISRYKEAELLAAVVSAFFTVFIKSQTPQTPLGETVPLTDKATASDLDADFKAELGPGSIIGLNTDEDISVANPMRPNSGFEPFVNAIAVQIGAALEIPNEVLMMRFNSSYSAARAALLQAWSLFRQWRSWMATDFCQPIYSEWLTEAILKGRISAPGFFDDPGVRAAWLRSSWHGPVMLSLDPVKEAQAAKLRIEMPISTLEREAAEMTGMEITEVIEQRAAESADIAAAGLVVPKPVGR